MLRGMTPRQQMVWHFVRNTGVFTVFYLGVLWAVSGALESWSDAHDLDPPLRLGAGLPLMVAVGVYVGFCLMIGGGIVVGQARARRESAL